MVIQSTPSGADIAISNGLSGTTPATFKLDRDWEGVVKISKDGFETVEVNVTHQASGAGGAGMAGNVLLGGVIGAAVDAGSGAMYDLVPNPIDVVLVPVDGEASEAAEPAPAPTIEAKLKELKDLLESGTITQEEHDSSRKKVLESIN